MVVLFTVHVFGLWTLGSNDIMRSEIVITCLINAKTDVTCICGLQTYSYSEILVYRFQVHTAGVASLQADSYSKMGRLTGCEDCDATGFGDLGR
jgi:hypothetical protein